MNYLSQRFVTRTLDLTDSGFETKVKQCSRHLDNYHAIRGGATYPRRVLEIGTGWEPIVPLGLWLCGAIEVFSLDIVNHLRQAKVKQVLRKFIDFGADGRLFELLPGALAGKVDTLQTIYRENDSTPSNILTKLGITTLVGDARQIPLDSSSIDLIVSNDTLEHIPEQPQVKMFPEFGRVASPCAVMSHFINMRDHYVSFDNSITSYNFCRFSDRWWRAFNSRLHYQNRLRISDYRRIHEVGGFRIIREETTGESSEQLKGLPLAPTFLRYSRADLLVTEAWIISVPSPSQS